MITGLNLKRLTKGLEESLINYGFEPHGNNGKVYYGWRVRSSYFAVADNNYYKSIKSSDDIVKVIYRLQRFR